MRFMCERALICVYCFNRNEVKQFASFGSHVEKMDVLSLVFLPNPYIRLDLFLYFNGAHFIKVKR